MIPSAPRGDARTAERGDIFPVAGTMAGIENNRKVGLRLQNGDGVDVGGVSSGGLKGTDAAFAENHVLVALRKDVFCCHEQVVDGGTHAAFEQNGAFRLSGCFEQSVILHISCPDLQHFGVIGNERNEFGCGHFGYDRQAG